MERINMKDFSKMSVAELDKFASDTLKSYKSHTVRVTDPTMFWFFGTKKELKKIMKRLEVETFEAYKKRRKVDKLDTDRAKAGKLIHDSENGKTYIRPRKVNK